MRRLKWVSIFLCGWILFWCNFPVIGAGERPTTLQADYSVIGHSYYNSLFKEGQYVCQTYEEWLNRFDGHFNIGLSPEQKQQIQDILSNDSHDIAIIAMGTQPSGGYSIVIDDAKVQNEELVLNYKYLSPAPDELATMALTQPVIIFKVSTRFNNIKFQQVID